MSDVRRALTQPLVTRPEYGRAGPAMPTGDKQAVSGLPEGGPTDKGLPLDSGIPGTSTFTKPVDDIRDFDRSTDSPIKRVDGPDDLLKDRGRIDVREDNADKHDDTAFRGEGESSGTGKTDWPYRDDYKTTHWASVGYVAEMWKLRTAHELRLPQGASPNLRLAVRLDEILDGVNPKVVERAQKCQATLKRADTKNLRWIFAVNCGNGPKVVRVKATRSGRIVKLTKMDLSVSCSCKAWSWLGPEHAAKTNGYLDGKPAGTASAPDEKDPHRKNRVCKHVAAVLNMARDWEVPGSK